MQYLIYGGISFLFISLGGLGYFTIWRLTQKSVDNSTETNNELKKAKHTGLEIVKSFNLIKRVILNLNQRLCDLETEIKLQKSDSARLVEWLDKERLSRDSDRAEFLKALKITERESKIIELGERLKLITTKK